MNMQEKLNNNNNNNCKKKNKGNKEDSNTIASQFCHWIRYHTRTIIGKELERNQYITLLKANSRAREMQVTLNMNMFCPVLSNGGHGGKAWQNFEKTPPNSGGVAGC